MENDVFTAGIEHGGLTTEFEIRMLICFLLDRIKTPVTLSQISFALQQEGLVNYFEITRAVGQLLTSGHLEEKNAGQEQERPLAVTPLGSQTAAAFEKNVPRSVREKALMSMEKMLLNERLERENRFEIERINDGYRVHLAMSDVTTDLLNLSLYVPTLALCEEIRRRFLENPGALYCAVMEQLTGKSLDTPLPGADEESPKGEGADISL